MDPDVQVSVWPVVFVPESQCMHQLVIDRAISHKASTCQRHDLLSADTANRTVAPDNKKS